VGAKAIFVGMTLVRCNIFPNHVMGSQKASAWTMVSKVALGGGSVGERASTKKRGGIKKKKKKEKTKEGTSTQKNEMTNQMFQMLDRPP